MGEVTVTRNLPQTPLLTRGAALHRRDALDHRVVLTAPAAPLVGDAGAGLGEPVLGGADLLFLLAPRFGFRGGTQVEGLIERASEREELSEVRDDSLGIGLAPGTDREARLDNATMRRRGPPGHRLLRLELGDPLRTRTLARHPDLAADVEGHRRIPGDPHVVLQSHAGEPHLDVQVLRHDPRVASATHGDVPHLPARLDLGGGAGVVPGLAPEVLLDDALVRGHPELGGRLHLLTLTQGPLQVLGDCGLDVREGGEGGEGVGHWKAFLPSSARAVG